MREPIYEIVPNLSEGRELAIVDDAASAALAAGAAVLHATSDATHHRSVLTIAGSARAVLDAAVAVAGVAAEYIDLRVHRGVHPRIGALDVLPFVPLAGGATMDGASELAREAAARIWELYAIPSFFYGAAASRKERILLRDLRRGEFEGLDARAALPGGAYDVGTAKHPSAGAVAIGARPVLIAFNVELATGDLAIGKRIARELRERDGGLQTLRALAFPLEDGHVQVSFNVTDYAAVPLHRLVEMVRALAAEDGVTVAKGELIGCLPLQAVTTAACYYLGVADA